MKRYHSVERRMGETVSGETKLTLFSRRGTGPFETGRRDIQFLRRRRMLMQTFATKRYQPQGQGASRWRWSRPVTPQAQLPLQRANSDTGEARFGVDEGTPAGFDFSQLPIRSESAADFQAKLAVSSPGDTYEQEADRVSDEVMRVPEGQREGDVAPVAKYQAAEPGTGDVRVQMKRMGGSDVGQTAAPPIVHEALRSPGQSLSAATRAFMGGRFGHDFSGVRVHADGEAADAARAVRARAYTVGSNIVFGEGEYAPSTAAGQRLLAHELTHVVQQQAAGAPHILSRKPDEGKKESEGKKEGEGKKEKQSKTESKEEKEEKERAKILADSTDGSALTVEQVGRIEGAMRGFSLHQLRAMRNAGLRFWQGDSLPPEFAGRVEVKVISTPAEYLDVIHVIRMAPNASTDAIRHEIAHAWDHARGGKLKPVGKLKDDDLVRAVEKTPPLSSETKEKRLTKETNEGKVRAVRLPMSEMLARYRRWKLREQSFDNPSTREGYSKSSTREFYAEGYSVFHGGKPRNQARLLYYAPELYELLEAEAKEEGLPVPDRSELAAAMKEQGLQP